MRYEGSALGEVRGHRSWEQALLCLMVGVLVLAFVSRLYLLDGQSLWADEGASVVMAGRQPLEILDHAAADIHPPLYYLLLHWWSGLVGKTEYALRFLSVAVGMGLVALTYALGRRLLEGWAGLLGSFLAALSPFQIYYAQEARMYMPMAFFAALSFFLFLKLAQPGQAPSPSRRPWWAWVAYGLASLAALYSQYFAAAILVAANLLFALLFWRFWRHLRWWGIWLLCQAVVGVLYVPWLTRAWPQLSSWPAISEPLALGDLGRQVLLVFSFGLSWDATATLKTQLLVLLLLAGSLLWPWTFGRRGSNLSFRQKGLVMTVLFLAVPVFTLYMLSLRRPFYQPKFLLLASPPFLLLLGLGLLAYGRLLSRVVRLLFSRSRILSPLAGAALVALGLAALVFALSRSTLAYYGDPKYGRDDYRGLVRLIERLEEPQDALLLNAPGQIEIFSYYYRGDLPVLPLPRERPPDRRATEAALEDSASRYQRLWGVYWAAEQSDPEGVVEGWLNRRAFPSPPRRFGGVRLVLYRLPMAMVPQRQPLDLRFGTALELVGYEVQAPKPEGAGVLANLLPGEMLPLTLLWRAREPLSQRYKVFTHFLDAQGLLWGQHDAEPANGSLPTPLWSPGEVIRDNHGLLLLLGTPPGEYEIEVGLYDAVSGQRLPVFDREGKPLGDRLLLGQMAVGKPQRPAAREALGLRKPMLASFGELRLLGAELGKLGAPQERARLHPGDPAQLVLYWQATATPTRDHTLLLRLVEASGRTVGEWRTQPLGGRYPTSRWEAEEVVRDQHKLALDLPPGRYRLLLDVPTVSGAQAPLAVGSVEVR